MTKRKFNSKRKKWTDYKIKYLKKNFRSKEITEIAKKLERSVSSIRAAVFALKLEK